VASWRVEHFGSSRPDEGPTQVQGRIGDVFELLAQPAVNADVDPAVPARGNQRALL
jgi:hypothetical protein